MTGRNSDLIVFIDTEINMDGKICDFGAVKNDGLFFHSGNIGDFISFVSGAEFICGHNIVNHDLKYLPSFFKEKVSALPIDTLYLSPLLFPKKPYHALLKNDKIINDELNNPLSDSKKAKELFDSEVQAFSLLSLRMKRIFYFLLAPETEFKGFFKYINFKISSSDFLCQSTIKSEFKNLICSYSDLAPLIKNHPVELAYVLALIKTDDRFSITPPWLLKNFPEIENIIALLCGKPCEKKCHYCREKLNVFRGLERFFGFKHFRTFNGEPLQENAARAALNGISMLAVFPTGGGKSITFQLPALISGAAFRALTVVISPLQSLMKDQVDNLNQKGISEAVTLNGLLNPIERADVCRRILDGTVSLLYVSPESLRSKTLEKMLLSRNIARFVIDEAHCFSAWGHDFRVDYLYIGDFILELQKKKKLRTPIPVSCFTATAKQKVISDICDYFKRKLDLHLQLFATEAERKNLRYTVLFAETEKRKYEMLRRLLEQKKCSAIVYVSRTGKSLEIAERLVRDGFSAKPFNGKMDAEEKIANQEAFIKNEVQIIVATSAFGMGVDKKDIQLIVHYNISDSLENYEQETGRAGRDKDLKAECYVLYNDEDLDKHFILLNSTKLSISEIQQVWKAVKDLTGQRNRVCCSPLEIARKAGWNDNVFDIETRIKTAVNALENAGYVKRGHNMPRVYATGIQAKNFQEAAAIIENSPFFNDEKQRENAKRIIKSLISSRSIARAGNDDAESRVDYLADILGIEKAKVIEAVNLMREAKLLEDSHDMSAYIFQNDKENKTAGILETFIKLERFVVSKFKEEIYDFNLKELNEKASEAGIKKSSVKKIRIILYYLALRNYIKKEENIQSSYARIKVQTDPEKMLRNLERRGIFCRFISKILFEEAEEKRFDEKGEKAAVRFSLVGLLNAYKNKSDLELISSEETTIKDIEEALLYLSKIGAMSLEGGFLVTYNGMEIRRLIDSKKRYKKEDYKNLNEFYKQKIRQIHIVGEYANLMVEDYNAARQFVRDYFLMDFNKFISKYFKEGRAGQIEKNITQKKYDQIFKTLSDSQLKIIEDEKSTYIVTAAGPGSGKTMVLVHKLASLLLLEDVKPEQLLMITFSRSAATEFKKRLIELIGETAFYVDIKTFHSFCFDLLGKVGTLEKSDGIIKEATEMIKRGEVEPGKITKSVLVIDEAQDMDGDEYEFVRTLIGANETMRVIAVGDDDQNIYSFRGSDSKYFRNFLEDFNTTFYELDENYRSVPEIVSFSNAFVSSIQNRMKTKEIVPVKKNKGIVQIIYHENCRFEEGAVRQFIRNREEGSTGILTETNDEALSILTLLLKNNIRAKLIQSADGFSVYNIAEIRFFLKMLNQDSPLISEEKWKEAKNKLKLHYKNSSFLEECLIILKNFEEINPAGKKYRSNLEEFIRESDFEDFYPDNEKTVYISTIHKSKGREFDSVYLILSGTQFQNDEEKRKLYVGMTRAKKALYIHCSKALFSNMNVSGTEKISDPEIYDEPTERIVQMGHRDVFLDFFKGKKREIFQLQSGYLLFVKKGYLTAECGGKKFKVVKFSKNGQKKIDMLAQRGYFPFEAFVRFIVAWKGMNDEEETAVILPDIYFRKQR